MTEELSDGSKLIKCTVISCPNYFHEDLSNSPTNHHFFLFPEDYDIGLIWKEKCGVSKYHSTSDARVCSEHFRFSDFEDEEKTVLKDDAIPRENLGWMIGMPEVKLVKPLKLDQVKEAVDTNERLKQRFDKLIKEVKPIHERISLYNKKIENVEKEVCRLNRLIAKYPVKSGKTGNNLICKVFSQAQINMLLGKKKVVWSYDDMAMAFTLRHIGNKECYLYLKNTLNMPLPALSAVQRWVASNK